MTDFNSYVDPGVYIDEIVTPVISSIGSPFNSVVALVGESQGYRSTTEQITLTGTASVDLSNVGINVTTITVIDRYTGATYLLTTDYTVYTDANVTAITRVGGGAIASGRDVLISYQFTNLTYYDVQAFTDYDSIRDFFGTPLTSSGTVNSPVTLAAFLAFVNGATTIVIVPVKDSNWTAALVKSKDRLDINVIVPVTASAAVISLAVLHVIEGEALSQLRRTFIGLDGVTSTKVYTDHISQATGAGSSRVTAVAPGSLEFFTGVGTTTINLHGGYIAAAVAGAFASRQASVPLTRKQIKGFTKVSSPWTETEMILAQKNGVCVLAQQKNGKIIVRHGLTTDMSNVYTQEISVQASKDVLVNLLQEVLEQQNLIGSVITTETPSYVISATAGALENAKSRALIYNYTGLKYRQPVNQPTVIEVRFMYRPSLPLNYIQVQFSIDTQTGSAVFIEVGV